MPRVWSRLTFRYTVFFWESGVIQSQHRRTIQEVFELLELDSSQEECQNILRWDAKTPMLGQYVTIPGGKAVVVRTK